MGMNYISQSETERLGKEMGQRRDCKSKTTACSLFTEHERQGIFSYIWKLTWGEKRTFIQALQEKGEPKRPYNKTYGQPKISFTWNYYLKSNGINVKAFKVMFLATTSLTQNCVRAVMD